MDELSKYGKIMVLKYNSNHRNFSEEFINENDNRLKELYVDYLLTRPQVFRSKFPNIAMNLDDVEPDFNYERGFLFKKCTSEDFKSVIFFKQDELPIFFNFKKYLLIDMS